MLITGDFDIVVSSVSRLSKAQQSLHLEAISEVREPRGAGSSGGSVPELHSTGIGRENRLAHSKCHLCHKLGHIARHCEKKQAYFSKNGNTGASSKEEAGKKDGG